MQISSSAQSQASLAALFQQRITAKYDSDQDGSLTADELNTASDSQSTDSTKKKIDGSALVKAFDQDGDGKLSASELQTGFQQLATDTKGQLLKAQEDANSQFFTAADGDGSGGLSLDEFSTALKKLPTDGQNSATQAASSSELSDGDISNAFAALDANGDGAVSQDELQSGLEKAGPPPGGPGGPHGAHHGHGHHHPQAAANDDSTQDVASLLDGGKNGGVSADGSTSESGAGGAQNVLSLIQGYLANYQPVDTSSAVLGLIA